MSEFRSAPAMPGVRVVGVRAARGAALALVLVLLTLFAFLPLLSAGFIKHDDPAYVTENPQVRAGLSLAGARWAMTAFESANWHPLTWLSHMADVQLYGIQPRGHHLTSLLLHALSAVLLLLVLARMTGLLWPSLFAAALFAVHPLHVESVAWIAERKDVLAGLFWMLTMAAYLGHVRRPGPGRYAAVLAAFALGLMSKPMLVTLPAVLLLLDWWPLGRMRTRRGTGAGSGGSALAPLPALALEKVPLLLMAAGSSAVTIAAQSAGQAVASLELIPLPLRVSNAVVAAATYLAKGIWPSGLSVFYPFDPAGLSTAVVVGAAAVLLAATVVAVAAARRGRPHLTLGWLWYLGTLVPVIGLIHVGPQSRADRYTYLPLIGIFILAAWEGRAIARRRGTRAMAAAAVAIIACFAALTFLQTRRWQDNDTLFRHALAVTKQNGLAHYHLGLSLFEQRKPGEAVIHLREAARISPAFSQVHLVLGAALNAVGEHGEAVVCYQESLRLGPPVETAEAAARNGLGRALHGLGRVPEAIESYREALRIEPGNFRAHINLGIALDESGRTEEAASHFSEAVRLQPGSFDAHANLGLLLARTGRAAEAEPHLRAALRLRPDDQRLRSELRRLEDNRSATPP